MSEPSPLQPALLHSLEACLAVCGDRAALRDALDELRPWTDELSRFAVDLFDLQLVRLGDPEARAGAGALATRLLEWWDSGSGARLAQLVPHLEELWLEAASTLASFEAVRFEKALQACWAARDDADALAEKVSALRPDGNQRVEFARCLIHLRLVRLGRAESRAEFARRVDLLTAAWRDPKLLDSLIGRDEGLRELWGLLLPLLRSFFGETEAPGLAEPGAGTRAEAQPEDATAAGPSEAASGDAELSDAPEPREGAQAAEAPAEGAEPGPPSRPASKQEQDAREPPPVPPLAESEFQEVQAQSRPPQELEPEPISLFDAESASAVTAPHELNFLDNRASETLPRRPTRQGRDPAAISVEIDITEVLDDTPRPAPPPAKGPPKPPPPSVDGPPPASRRAPAPDKPARPAGRPGGAGPQAPSPRSSPAPTASAPSSASLRTPPRSLDIEDTGYTPSPDASAFWLRAIAALDLLPRPDEQRAVKRLMPTGSKDERQRLGAFATSIEDAIHIPDARAFACLIQLTIAGQTKERGLFGKANEQRSELLASALSLLSAHPRAAGRAAVWFELDGPDGEAELQSGLELLLDYICSCARSRVDPLDARAQRNYLRGLH